MTNFITRNLKQVGTIWSRLSLDGYGGTSYTKTTCNCRWEDNQILFTDHTGQERVSKAIVYIDVDVAVGSFMLLGTSGSSTPPETAYEVKSFQKSPDIRGVIFERKVIL